jgi:hypothetical protein
LRSVSYLSKWEIIVLEFTLAHGAVTVYVTSTTDERALFISMLRNLLLESEVRVPGVGR